MDNKDLDQIIKHYRKEARKVVNHYAFRKIASLVIIFMFSIIGLEFNLLWLVTITFVVWIVLLINKFYRQPEFIMPDSFYKELSSLKIEDTEGLEKLKSTLKKYGYLYLDEVEDFIEREKSKRAVNESVSLDGAKKLLGS